MFLLLGNQSEGGGGGGDTELNETLPFDVVNAEHMEEQDDDDEVNDGGGDGDAKNKAAVITKRMQVCIVLYTTCVLYLSVSYGFIWNYVCNFR